jgi:hypothetical protein
MLISGGSRKLAAMIARSADFYGPDTQNAVLIFVFQPFARKRKRHGVNDAVRPYLPPDAAQNPAAGRTARRLNQTCPHHAIRSRERIRRARRRNSATPSRVEPTMLGLPIRLSPNPTML